MCTKDSLSKIKSQIATMIVIIYVYICKCLQFIAYILKLSTNSLLHTVLQPNITDIIITPDPNSDGQLLHEFNDTVSLTCTAEGGPRIMTRWQFDDGSTVETVANDSSSVTYEISSLSTDHTGIYYCEAIIDGMTDTSMNYILFGEYYVSESVRC